MRLYYASASPFVRKVMVTLHETGQADDVALLNVTTTAINSDPSLVAANPVGKIPALERDDGPTLYDSRVITRYLDSRANAGLYPENRPWETLTLEATGDGIMEAAVLMVYEARLRPEDKRFPDWVEAQWGKVIRGVGALNARWMSHLAGPLDAGHIAVGCALGYLDFRHEDRDWRTGHEALTDWYAEFSQRPSMVATEPVA